MTNEGRLKRGEENFKRQRFLDNSETLEYLASVPKEKSKKAEKPEEK